MLSLSNCGLHSRWIGWRTMPSWWCFSNFKVPYCSCCSVVSLLHITFRKWKLIKEPLDGLNFKVQWSDMGWIEWIQIRVSSWAMRRSGWRRCCTALALWTKMNFKKNLVDSKWKQELVLTKKKKHESYYTFWKSTPTSNGKTLKNSSRKDFSTMAEQRESPGILMG